jgi:hypothetical protein
MVARVKFSTLATFGFALLAGASAYAASPMSGFGPSVSGDQSLDNSLGALNQVVAWQNSPEGDVYQLALAVPAPEMPFENVAMESGSQDKVASGPDIFNDVSLNVSLRALGQVIAWQKSPEADAFQYALEDHLKTADFERVALASVPAGGFAPEY